MKALQLCLTVIWEGSRGATATCQEISPKSVCEGEGRGCGPVRTQKGAQGFLGTSDDKAPSPPNTAGSRSQIPASIQCSPSHQQEGGRERDAGTRDTGHRAWGQRT